MINKITHANGSKILNIQFHEYLEMCMAKPGLLDEIVRKLSVTPSSGFPQAYSTTNKWLVIISQNMKKM